MAHAETIAAARRGSTLYPLRGAHDAFTPSGVKGTFRTVKWAVLLVTLAVYYFLPFLRWHRGPHEPSQAILVDLANGRFYFFAIELWPQEVYYVTGLLILAAFTLLPDERRRGPGVVRISVPADGLDRSVHGGRAPDRGRPARAHPPGCRALVVEKFALKLLKHSVWLLIAWWTGGAWVLYFADAPTLVTELATFQAPPVAYAAIAILTFTTYTLAGLMREQVCTYMCPWPRIQGALTDEHSLAVTYRYDRGEPRGPAKRSAALRAKGLPAGDCVDCGQCVAACPAGIDIRDGLQMECIQCGLCADACNTVMAKVGRPLHLIAYDTDENCAAASAARCRSPHPAPSHRALRPAHRGSPRS